MIDDRVSPRPELPLASQLACAVIALGAHERSFRHTVNVLYPNDEGGGYTEAMLGELLIDAGEAVIAAEPSARFDPMPEPPRERFIALVRSMSQALQDGAPKRPRLVKPAPGFDPKAGRVR